MHDIYPLEIRKKEAGRLILELNKRTRISLYIANTVLPIYLIILSAATFVLYHWANAEGLFIIIPLLMLVAGLILILRGYTTGIVIDKSSVILLRKRFLFKPGDIKLDLSDYRIISTRVFKSRGGGGYVYLHKSNNGKTEILRIPLLQIREGCLANIAGLISEITGLPVHSPIQV